MNLLLNAMPYIENLIDKDDIEIINKYTENIKGYPKIFEDRIKCKAHVQPLNAQDLKKITSGTLDSNNMYKFYILGNNANVINFLEKIDCEILWKNKRFSIFSKYDWSKNGWIRVIGTLKGA